MAEPPGGRELRAVLNRARLNAIEAGSRDVRAEHLLLALLDEPAGSSRQQSGVGHVLAGVGLDRERLLEGLRLERAHSLSAVGFTALPDERLTATRLPSTPALGSSARDALATGHRTVTRERMAEQRAAHRRRAHRAGGAGATGAGGAGGADTGAAGAAAGAAGAIPGGAGRSARRPAGHRPDTGELALAVGVLIAELGTVPRALVLAGLDRQVLLDALLAAVRDG